MVGEKTGKRDLQFSNWIRENLPNPVTGLIVNDIDFFVLNWQTKKALILEVKLFNAQLKPHQERMYFRLNRWLRAGAAADGWQFFGCNVLKFERTNFQDGRVWFNGRLVTEQQLKQKLSI